MVAFVLIVAIIIAIVAIILISTAVGIIAATAGNQMDSGTQGQLNGAAALIGFSVVLIIVATIIFFFYYRTRTLKDKQAARGTLIAFWVVGGLAGVLLVIGLILAFVTSNQIDAESSDEARNVRGAAGSGLVGIILLIVALIIGFFYARTKAKV